MGAGSGGNPDWAEAMIPVDREMISEARKGEWVFIECWGIAGEDSPGLKELPRSPSGQPTHVGLAPARLELSAHPQRNDTIAVPVNGVDPIRTGGTLYPTTSNAIVITGGAGSCLEKEFVTLGAGLAGVVVTDASGTPIFAGN